MKVLITSAASSMSKALSASLASGHQVRLTEVPAMADEMQGREFTVCNLGHDEATNELVTGVDAIIHSAAVNLNDTASNQLNFAMRCTYNMLWAASEGGVSRFIHLSSLSIMSGYEEDLAVTERWRPVPTTEAATLCHHLGEYVCREFTREKKIEVVCLRLGEVVWDDGSNEVSSAELYVEDAVQAVGAALNTEIPSGRWGPKSTWNIFHIQSTLPNARFLTSTAQEILGYSPRQSD